MRPADRTPPPHVRPLRRIGRLARTVVPATLIATAISAASLTTAQAADTGDTASSAPGASTPGPWPDPYDDYPYPEPYPYPYPDPYPYPGGDPGTGPGLGLGPLLDSGPLLGSGPLLDSRPLLDGHGPLLGPDISPIADSGAGPALDPAAPLLGPGRGPFVAPFPGPGRLSGCDIDSAGVANATNRDYSVAVVRGRTFVGQRDSGPVGGTYTWQDLSGLPGYPVTGVCGASASASSTAEVSVKVVTYRGDVAESRCATTGALPVCGAWTALQGPLQQPPLAIP
ncbi:hypothetical protein PV392_15155 [Streptomyces sp. ME03-5709C]|nr:hypothetical protein [Streptomyces sp. ME03-5709C]